MGVNESEKARADVLSKLSAPISDYELSKLYLKVDPPETSAFGYDLSDGRYVPLYQAAHEWFMSAPGRWAYERQQDRTFMHGGVMRNGR